MVKIQVKVFWVMTPCSVHGRVPTFQRTLLPPSSGWRWRHYGPLKLWYLTTALHGITTQKTLTWTF